MHSPDKPDRSSISQIVISSVRNVLSNSTDESTAENVTESTNLIGSDSVLDSLGLVTLLVDIEQKLEEEYNISITIADDRAMSQRNSPFRSVQSLADYLHTLILEK